MAPVDLLEQTPRVLVADHHQVTENDDLFDDEELLIEEISIDGMCGVY
jgi:mycofactocin precursor